MQQAGYQPPFNEGAFQRSRDSLLYSKIEEILEHKGFKLKGSCPWVLLIQRKSRNWEAGPEDADIWNHQCREYANVAAHLLPKSDPLAAAYY